MTPSFLKRAVAGVAVLALACALNIALLPRHYANRVDVERVALAPLPLIVRVPGNLEAKASQTLKAEFDGPVVKKSFREGQEVRAGEELAVIGRDRLRLDYKNRQDAAQNAQSDLVRARKEARLQKALFRKQAVAYSSVEDAERAVGRAEQALQAAKESFRQIQEIWNQAVLTAPFSGTVVKDSLGDEKMVAAGREIATVSDVSEYSVFARVDELDSKQLRLGQEADVQVQIFDKAVLPAVVTDIRAAALGNGITEIPVVLKLKSTGGFDLRPKLTAEARIHTGQTEPVLSVPLSAVANADGQTRVWVLGAFHRLRARPVELGRSNPDRVEILRGLSAGERICRTAEPDFASGMMVLEGDDHHKNVSKTNRLIEKRIAAEGAKPARKAPSKT